MILYGYARSSASFRVRIALNLKGLAYEQRSVHLRKGDQFGADYAKVNPQQQVPSLVTDRGAVLVQSPAILEWLDEAYPYPPLLPKHPAGRARVRALAAAIGCDIHPIDNLRVLKYLQQVLQVTEGQFEDWFNHWIRLGFTAVERMLAESGETGRFCHGDAPGLADCYLVPQMFNAGRYKLDLAPFPTIRRIHAECMKLPEFDRAQWKNQPDWDG